MMYRSVVDRLRVVACMAVLAIGIVGCASTGGGPGASIADSELAASIAQRLSVDPTFRDQLFGVEVVGGEVTIRGAVRSEAERMRLLSTVRGTPGVTLVIDRLRVVR